MSLVRVVAGSPTSEELAVVVALLSRPAAAPAPGEPTPAWRHAGLLEGVGAPRVATRAALRRRWSR